MKRAGVIFIIIIFLNIFLANGIDEKDVLNKSTYIEGTKGISSKEINMLEPINTLIKEVFRLKEEKITVSLLVITLIIWLIITKLISDIAHLMPFFDKKLVAITASIIIATMIALTGIIKEITLFILNLKTLYTIIAIIIAVIILIIVSKFVKIFKKLETAGKITSAEIEGMKAGKGIETAKIKET